MPTNLWSLSDDELDREATRVAFVERQTTAELLRLLIEVERRGLHLAFGHSSLFAYCTCALRLSEQAAYGRIAAARAARRFPCLLDLLAEGALTLSSVDRLAPHLDETTVDALLQAARFKTTREVERILADAFPQPDIAPQIRALPQVQVATPEAVPTLFAESSTDIVTSANQLCEPRRMAADRTPARPVVAPIASTRYLLKVTLSQDTEQKLQRLRSLMRHSVPDGDLDRILNRALTLLLDQVGRAKAGRSQKPRTHQPKRPAGGRYLPAAVRREVWERDGGCCVFEGSDGRLR